MVTKRKKCSDCKKVRVPWISRVEEVKEDEYKTQYICRKCAKNYVMWIGTIELKGKPRLQGIIS